MVNSVSNLLKAACSGPDESRTQPISYESDRPTPPLDQLQTRNECCGNVASTA